MFFKRNLFNLIIFFIVYLSFMTTALGLEVVYPKSNYEQINSQSTFFLGNTDAGAKLEINGKPVKVYDNGSFTHVVNLKDGENRFFIKSTINGKTNELVYLINKPPQLNIPKKDVVEELPEGEYIYSIVMKANSPLRDAPDDNARRLTHLGEEVTLLLNGQQNDYYKVYLNSNKSAWIKSSLIVNYTRIKQKTLGELYNIKISEDKNYKYLKLSLNLPIAYILNEVGNDELELELYGIKNDFLEKENLPNYNEMKKFNFNYQIADNTLTIQLKPYLDKLWGYEAYYEKNTLVIKVRKTPEISSDNCAKNITVIIDAGHGGDETGAIGLDGTKEKDVNLAIAQKLKKSLKEVGFNVVMTRDNDTDVDLEKRVQIAKESDGLILLSLHANALADGVDPLSRSGTSTYYYNNQAKKLAMTIQKNMVEELQTNDDGVFAKSFVLTRPTRPLSVLIEVAYMINPNDYELLIDDNFQEKTAESIKNGLIKYLSGK